MIPDVLGRFAATTEVIREPEQFGIYETSGPTEHRVVPAFVALLRTIDKRQAAMRIW